MEKTERKRELGRENKEVKRKRGFLRKKIKEKPTYEEEKG